MACSTHPEPGWIDIQPKAENYWFGVGSVEKPFYGSDIREEARSKALSEIASQISVDISGSFEQVVTEHNLSLDEFAKSFNKVQGSDFHSNKEAANQSFKKISEKISENFLPELIDLIQGL